MATPNSNILYPLVKIRDLVDKMMAYDLSTLSTDELRQLQASAHVLETLAMVAVEQSYMVNENQSHEGTGA